MKPGSIHFLVLLEPLVSQVVLQARVERRGCDKTCLQSLFEFVDCLFGIGAIAIFRTAAQVGAAHLGRQRLYYGLLVRAHVFNEIKVVFGGARRAYAACRCSAR